MVTEVRWHEAVKSSGEASDISITVQDTQQRWAKSTYPQPGDKVALEIGYAGVPLVYAGQFTIDEFESRGPPFMMTLHGTEAWTTTDFLKSEKVMSFENMAVSAMAQQIANGHGWNLITNEIEPQQDLMWDRKTQCHESDHAFLGRLAEEHGFVFSVRPPNIIFYSLAALEAQSPTGPMITQEMVHRFSLRYQNLAEVTFLGGQHTYLNPATKEVQVGTVEASGDGANAVTANSFLSSNRLENQTQANALAAAQLHQANMYLYQGTIELPGTTIFRAGQTVALSDEFGYFSTVGNWVIEEAEHTIRAKSVYITRLTIRTAGPETTLIPGGATSP